MADKVETAADAKVRDALERHQNFALIAGAGSGKTSSLIDALLLIRAKEGKTLRQNDQKIACITFTKRAVEVIRARLDFDDLYLVSTVHSFLWSQISRFHTDIRHALISARLPALIEKEKGRDNGGNSKTALAARAKAARLADELIALETVPEFSYSDARTSNYPNGKLSHDDVLEVASYLINENSTLQRILGFRFPYIFVDEAQDTAAGVVLGLNKACEGEGLPLVGYFGDPWQQIYDTSIGDFRPPDGGQVITKQENFRCSESVIRLLNRLRTDVEQFAAGDNRGREGSVQFKLIQAENPELPRGRYSDDQTARALAAMDRALREWGWHGDEDVVQLFLVRQMIARRMGFSELNKLFTGDYASSRAEDDFEQGKHPLLLPLTRTVLPLVVAHTEGDDRKMVQILRRDSPAFAVDGANSGKSLKYMIDASVDLTRQLRDLWNGSSIRDVLSFCVEKQIVDPSDRLVTHLTRQPRDTAYNETLNAIDKGDWLADDLFKMSTTELEPYSLFISDHSALSTQHGVKGEEYGKVLVVYDDIEAAWNTYSFGKILTPRTIGQPTEGQASRGRKLAYVCFSRAEVDLRVVLFTPNPGAARDELIEAGLLDPTQVDIQQ